jgi:hypothetical protein
LFHQVSITGGHTQSGRSTADVQMKLAGALKDGVESGVKVGIARKVTESGRSRAEVIMKVA